MNQFELSEPDPVLDNLNRALPPERADLPYDDPHYQRAIDREVTDQIHQSGGSSMESLEEQIRLRRELFENRYYEEYGSPAVRQILRDNAIEHTSPKQFKAKQSRRLP